MGFGHKAVLSVAPQVIQAIQEKRLEHIFLVGGCDGSEPQRKYYSKLYQYMPTNTMVLTLGCGKFRIFDQDFGTLPGTDLPRLLDMGQCECCRAHGVAGVVDSRKTHSYGLGFCDSGLLPRTRRAGLGQASACVPMPPRRPASYFPALSPSPHRQRLVQCAGGGD